MIDFFFAFYNKNLLALYFKKTVLLFLIKKKK